MVTITKDNHAANGLNESAFIKLIECLKPCTYLGVGVMLGLVILNGDRQKNMLRGSSLDSVHMKNMTMPEPPIIHIDINFPEHQSDQKPRGFLPPTVNMMQGDGVLDANVNSLPMEMMQEPQVFNTNTAYNGMPAEHQTMAGTTGFDGIGATTNQMQGQIMQPPAQLQAQMQAGTVPMQNGGQMQMQAGMQDPSQLQLMPPNDAVPMSTTEMNRLQTENMPMQDAPFVQQEQSPPMQDGNLPQQPPVQYGGQMQSFPTEPMPLATNAMDQSQIGSLPLQDGNLPQQPPVQYGGQMQSFPTDPMPVATTEVNQSQTGSLPMQDGNLPQQPLVQEAGQMQSFPSEPMPVAGSDERQIQFQADDTSVQQPEVERFKAVPTTTQVSSDGSVPRPIMYTFYDSIDADNKGIRSTGMDEKSDNELLTLWKAHWNEAGWDARILSLKDAKRHPDYYLFVKRLDSLPMKGVNGKGANRRYNQLCFLRWLAVAAAGGGFMSDYDLFPLDHGTGDPALLPSVDLPNNGDFTIYSIVPKSQAAAVPCLMSGRSDEWTRLAMKILESALKMEKEKETHITDMFALIALRFDKVYNARDDVVNGEYVLLGRDWSSEDCAITKGKRGVHFSHHALTAGDASFIKKGDIGASDRPGVIKHWLHQWKNECSAV